MTWITSMGMFNRKSRKEREMELMKAVIDASKAQSEAVAQIAKTFAAYIDSFKVDSPPEQRQHADQMAFERETIEEMEARGLPVGATELDRLRWIAKTVDFS